MRFGLTIIGLLAFSSGVAAQEVGQPKPVQIANGDFESAADDGSLATWKSNTLSADAGSDGYVVSIDSTSFAEGKSSARIEGRGKVAAGQYGTLHQWLDVSRLRGRKIRLSASVRVSAAAPEHAGLFLRVNRHIGAPILIDDMIDRPIISSEWQRYTIEADVAPDAQYISLGFLIGGEGAGWVDDLKVEDIGPASVTTLEDPTIRSGPPRDGPIDGDVAPSVVSDRGADNLKAFARLYGLVRGFHPTKETMSVDWDRFLIAHIPDVEGAENANELAKILRKAFAPLTSGLMIADGPITAEDDDQVAEHHIRWRHTGFAPTPWAGYSSTTETIASSDAPDNWTETLPGDVAISLPLSVPVDRFRRTLPVRDIDLTMAMGKPEGWVPAGFDRTTRIAGIIKSWALLDQFYPYWDVVDTDWDAEFEPALQEAAMAEDDIAHSDALSRLIAQLHDGHGRIFYRYDAAYMLPLDWAWIDGNLVVTATTPQAVGVEKGMIVKEINGVPAKAALGEKMALTSGSKHSKIYVAEIKLRNSHAAGDVELTLQSAAGEVTEVTVPLDRATRDSWFLEKRPEKVTELSSGVLYADLTRLSNSDLVEAVPEFEAAKAIIFDVRGYPRGRSDYLAHLTDTIIRSAEMNRAIQTKPDANFDRLIDNGWVIKPELPRYTKNIVWMTDGSAGSYPESILGTVKANGLGRIVGSATAGANGNYTKVRLPGGYELRWTGMQVINRDGSQHHNVGVLPDVAVERTLEGVRADRDELLEVALAEAKRMLSES